MRSSDLVGIHFTVLRDLVKAMVDRSALPASFCELLEEAVPWVFSAEYMAEGSALRYLDFFECFSGRAKLANVIQEVPLRKPEVFCELCLFVFIGIYTAHRDICVVLRTNFRMGLRWPCTTSPETPCRMLP